MKAKSLRSLRPWNNTRISSRLGIEYPIIQGPLGGLSSQQLTAIPTNESETSKMTGGNNDSPNQLTISHREPNVFDRYAPLDRTSQETK
jgi:hypothetical protein